MLDNSNGRLHSLFILFFPSFNTSAGKACQGNRMPMRAQISVSFNSSGVPTVPHVQNKNIPECGCLAKWSRIVVCSYLLWPRKISPLWDNPFKALSDDLALRFAIAYWSWGSNSWDP